jgi:hypothetical protein
MVVRMSALPAARPLPPGRFLILTSVRDWVDPRVILPLERLGRLKYQMSTLRIELAIFHLVLQCLNQWRYYVLPVYEELIRVIESVKALSIFSLKRFGLQLSFELYRHTHPLTYTSAYSLAHSHTPTYRSTHAATASVNGLQSTADPRLLPVILNVNC